MSIAGFHRRPRWTWPVAWSITLVLGIGAMLVPESWWWLLIPDRDLEHRRGQVSPPAMQLVELEVVAPPPEIAAVPDPEPEDETEPEIHLDPDWWTRSWSARIVSDFAPAHAAVPDSLLPRPLLDILGAQATVDLVLSQPDSAVQARIWWLVQEEELTRDDLDGLFSAIARARAYADMRQREAAMFDEFINETVPVPR